MSLGNFIKQNGIDIPKDTPCIETIEEFPLEAFMSGNVRFRQDSVLDELDEYIASRLDSLEKYNANPNHNEKYLKERIEEQSKLERIASTLRKDKVELWLHVMPYVREYVKQYGEVGILQVTIPFRHGIDKTANIDFINNKMIVF